MRSKTQPIPLDERPRVLRLQPQRLELYGQHGRRVMEHARHRILGVVRLSQSFRGNLDDELVAACSPPDSRDAADVVLAVVLQLLENPKELAGDLEFVTVLNPLPRRLDVAGSAVTKCCTAYTYSLSSLATRHGPV